MRESANSFAWTIWRLFDKDNSVHEKIRFVQDYYGLLDMENEMKDGLTPYPAPDALESEGMKIEFKDVSMKYPQSDSFALRNVSFTVEPGVYPFLGEYPRIYGTPVRSNRHSCGCQRVWENYDCVAPFPTIRCNFWRNPC